MILHGIIYKKQCWKNTEVVLVLTFVNPRLWYSANFLLSGQCMAELEKKSKITSISLWTYLFFWDFRFLRQKHWLLKSGNIIYMIMNIMNQSHSFKMGPNVFVSGLKFVLPYFTQVFFKLTPSNTQISFF